MIKKPLLKIIHFTLLFIIGLLFTIFLQKIKNAIFIEKFNNPFAGITQFIKDTAEIVEATTIPNPIQSARQNTIANPLYNKPSVQSVQSVPVPKQIDEISSVKDIYHSILYSNKKWDYFITHKKSKLFSKGAKAGFNELSVDEKLKMVFKFKERYGKYPTKDFRDAGRPYKDSDDNLRYVFSGIWNKFNKPDTCRARKFSSYEKCWKERHTGERNMQYKQHECCYVFGPWAWGHRDPRNGDNRWAYQLYMGLYDGLADFLQNEVEVKIESSAAAAIDLFKAKKNIETILKYYLLETMSKNIPDDDPEKIKDLLNELVSEITESNENGEPSTLYMNDWPSVMFETLKKIYKNTPDKTNIKSSIQYIRDAAQAEANRDVFNSMDKWAKSVLIHLLVWTSEPHEIVNNITSDNIGQNKIKVEFTADLSQKNNIFENWYEMIISKDDTVITKQSVSTPFEYTFPKESKDGLYKLQIMVVNDMGNTTPKSIDINRETPVDCKGITLPCSINCETGSNRFIVTQEAVAGGSPCDYPSDCEDGDGVCDSNRLKRVGSGGSWPDKISSIDELNRARQLIIPPWVGEVITWDEHKDKSTIDEDKLTQIYR